MQNIYPAILMIGLGLGLGACREGDENEAGEAYRVVAAGEGSLAQVKLGTAAESGNSADASAIQISGGKDLVNEDTTSTLGINDGMISGGPSVYIAGAAADEALSLTLERSPWLENIGEKTVGAPSLLTAKVAALKGDHTMEINKNLAVVYQLKEGAGSKFGFIGHQELSIAPEYARFAFQGEGIYQLVYVWDSNADYGMVLREDLPIGQ